MGGVERLDDLPLRDVAAFLDGLVTLVARGSAEIIHRPIRVGGGRYEGPIEDASHIRLASLVSGSVVAELLPAAEQASPGAIGLTAETLSEQAIALVLDVAGGREGAHPDLAKALIEFSDRCIGRRPSASLTFEDRRPARERQVVVDHARLSALRASVAARPSTTQPKEVTGRLFEANLETHSAQVRTPAGEKVDVRFGPEHDEDVRRLLGNRAALRGDITYDPKSSNVKSVRIREIVTGDQMGLNFEGVDFWVDRPLSALIEETGAVAVDDPNDLEVRGASRKQWDALYEVLDLAG